ncbi:MAG: AraC family transcriptional regulator [Caldilineaceae bacterium]
MTIQQERAKFWHDPTLGNLELLHASYITHSFAPHTHEGYAIGVIEAGAETFRYRHATHVAPAGSIVVINPGEAHTGEAVTVDGWRYRMLYPAAAQLLEVTAQLKGRTADYPFFPAPVIVDPVLAQQMANVHRHLEQSSSVLERQSLWTALLAQLIVRHADARPLAQTPQPQTLDALLIHARDYLADHYAADLTLPELAAHVHLSPFHLLRSFKATFGLTPHAYVIQRRIHRAKALLLAGAPLADVALQVGFTDQSHFTRHFKRIVGVPPGHYMQTLNLK